MVESNKPEDSAAQYYIELEQELKDKGIMQVDIETVIAILKKLRNNG